MEWLIPSIAVGGFALTAGTLLVTVTKQISGIESRLEISFKNSLSALKKEFYEQNDKLRSEVAETIKPLRTLVTDYEKKHYELELYIRDNYIEVPTFKEALNDIKTSLGDVTKRLQKMSDDNSNWRRGKTPAQD